PCSARRYSCAVSNAVPLAPPGSRERAREFRLWFARVSVASVVRGNKCTQMSAERGDGGSIIGRTHASLPVNFCCAAVLRSRNSVQITGSGLFRFLFDCSCDRKPLLADASSYGCICNSPGLSALLRNGLKSYTL